MNDKPILAVHGHFYQPPREDPFTGTYRVEPEADPYRNWNARITAECYAPNVRAGNFARISFNLGGTLARWMDLKAHSTYEGIVKSAWSYYRRHNVTNGLVQAVHHTILPLARTRDKRCQIHWGIASFRHRFGLWPDGLWLPEMAVDYATLEAVVRSGLWFVVLSDEQVHGDLTRGAGPYKVRLGGDRSITVFVRDRHLSNAFSFNMPPVEHARAWVNGALRGAEPGSLTLLATDGETFGHHHQRGVEVLRAITMPQKHDIYRVTTISDYLRHHSPEAELEIIEDTAWSCAHHLGRWATGCVCTGGCNHWKGALRRALDNLSCALDEIYVDVVENLNVAPWALRDDYIRVLLEQIDGPAFLQEHDLGHLHTDEQNRLLTLLKAQVHRQRMFTSCTFFFEDLERIEPRYAIANAVKSIALVRLATGEDLTSGFKRDLRIALSGSTGRTGAQILEEILAQAQVGKSPYGEALKSTRPTLEV
jgi:alpha-amylase/alpha-mannosidase (GH57 family)